MGPERGGGPEAVFDTEAGRSAREETGDSAGSGGTMTFQDVVFKLKQYWSRQGCLIQEPYDVEVGAGTMCPETFLRVLGPKPYRVAYVQPSSRPAEGRYGENPNRLLKQNQIQELLTPQHVAEQVV